MTEMLPVLKICDWTTSGPGSFEFLRRGLAVFVHGLAKLLPHPGFCLSDILGWKLLSLPVAACCLGGPTGQPWPLSLLLQLDSPFHLWCPPAGPWVIAITSINDLATTAASGRLDNGSTEHGPLRFHVPRYHRDVVETPPEVGVEGHFHRVLSQMFPAELHYLLGPVLSVWLPSLPPDPTHHQGVICWQLWL